MTLRRALPVVGSLAILVTLLSASIRADYDTRAASKGQTQIHEISFSNYRVQLKDKNVMRFNAGIGGKPASFRIWSDRGGKWGEFASPKAKSVGQPRQTEFSVLTPPSEEVAKFDSAAEREQLAQLPDATESSNREAAQVVQTKPPGARQVDIAQAQVATPTLMALAKSVAATELPATASYLPLIALSGLLALGGAIGVRALARVNR